MKVIRHKVILRIAASVFVASSFSLSGNSQNLVPNADFESYSECPDFYSQTDRLDAWNAYRGTPDYYYSCDETNIAGVPYNQISGFQPALSGEGYIGIYGILHDNTREIIGVELLEPLEIGVEYFISFYWSRAFGGAFHSNCDCASSNLGALFTTEPFDFLNNPIEVGNFAHVFDGTVHEDSTNWVEISGWFIADQAYTHLAIGNHFDLDQIQLEYFNTDPSETTIVTYYYIDNVCVTTDVSNCQAPNSSSQEFPENQIQIFPNPTTGLVMIKSGLQLDQVHLMNVLGQTVKQWSLNGAERFEFDASDVEAGVYLLQVRSGNKFSTLKLIVE